MPVHSFPFDSDALPRNGIYILFEDGEKAHDGERIVRIGTHAGENQLGSRLAQHFTNENKDRSIFRKNIGRALLAHAGDPFLADWNLDLTSSAAKHLHSARIDFAKQRAIEQQVTAYMRTHFRFVAFRADAKELRLRWESQLISTISRCEYCRPSPQWLGLSSPHRKISESGLWQVNQLYREPFSPAELKNFERGVTPSDCRSEGGSPAP